MTVRYDLRINQGETWRCDIPVAFDNPAATLSGATVRGQIRGMAAGGTALHTWGATENNVDLGVGAITLHVPAAVSSDWTWTSGLWDLELVDTGGSTTRLVEGVVWVTPEITR